LSLQGDIDDIIEKYIAYFLLDFDGVPFLPKHDGLGHAEFHANRDICSPFFDLTVSVLVLPAMANIEGVGDEWEDDIAVREYTRSTGIVTQRPVGMKWCEPNRPNCVANSLVLTPLLQRMHDEDGYKLPSLEDLKRQIAILYHRLGASPSEKVIYTTAVELKKLCSFVKRRTNRLEVTKDRMNQVDLNMLISYVTYNGFIFFWWKDSSLYRKCTDAIL